MHICVGKLTIIGWDNGLSPGRRQAIISTNAGILLIRPLGTNFSEIWIEIDTFSLKKMHLKMLSKKWRPFCLGLNVLNEWGLIHCIKMTFMFGYYFNFTNLIPRLWCTKSLTSNAKMTPTSYRQAVADIASCFTMQLACLNALSQLWKTSNDCTAYVFIDMLGHKHETHIKGNNNKPICIWYRINPIYILYSGAIEIMMGLHSALRGPSQNYLSAPYLNHVSICVALCKKTIIITVMIISILHFAHATIAHLSWHAQICGLKRLSK